MRYALQKYDNLKYLLSSQINFQWNLVKSRYLHHGGCWWPGSWLAPRRRQQPWWQLPSCYVFGVEWSLSVIRKHFWMVKARPLIKQVIQSCVTCRRLYAKLCVQQMADLPQDRHLSWTNLYSLSLVWTYSVRSPWNVDDLKSNVTGVCLLAFVPAPSMFKSLTAWIQMLY